MALAEVNRMYLGLVERGVAHHFEGVVEDVEKQDEAL
jgi:hypothetical protein